MLAAVLVLAALLRLAWLGRMSLWMDEGFTLTVASAPWSRLNSTAVTLDWHPIGSYVFAKLGLQTMPDAEWGLRLPAAVFGILTVIALFPLAREVFAESKPSGKPLATTSLGAVMSMLVMANRDGRSYAPAILALTVATLGWTCALRSQGKEKTRWWSLWVIAGLGAAYCHYYTLVVLAWQWMVATKTQTRAACWWATLPVVAVCYAPAVPRLVQQLSLPARGHPPPGWHEVVDVFFAQTVGFTLNFSSIWIWYGLAACGLAAAAFGLWTKGPIHRIAVVYWGFVATLVGIPLLSPKGVFETKYFVLLSPLFILLLTEAIFSFPWRSLRWTALAALLTLNLTSTLNAIAVPEWYRQDFRGAAGVISKNARDGDVLLLEPDWLEYVTRHYLGGDAGKLRWTPLSAAASLDFQAASLPPQQRVWVLRAALASPASQTLPQLLSTRPLLLHWKSYRRARLQEVELFLFGSGGGAR